MAYNKCGDWKIFNKNEKVRLIYFDSYLPTTMVVVVVITKRRGRGASERGGLKVEVNSGVGEEKG